MLENHADRRQTIQQIKDGNIKFNEGLSMLNIVHKILDVVALNSFLIVQSTSNVDK